METVRPEPSKSNLNNPATINQESETESNIDERHTYPPRPWSLISRKPRKDKKSIWFPSYSSSSTQFARGFIENLDTTKLPSS